MIYLLCSRGYDDEVADISAAFTERDRAEHFVAIWDDAVKQSLRDNPAGGVCKKGDWFVLEVELDPERAPMLSKGTYLYEYLPTEARDQ